MSLFSQIQCWKSENPRIENEFTPRKVLFDVNKRYEREIKIWRFYWNTLYLYKYKYAVLIYKQQQYAVSIYSSNKQVRQACKCSKNM